MAGESDLPAALIECLRNVEIDFSNFLSEDGGRFLTNEIRRMNSEPELAIENLGQKFKGVVEPRLLNQFRGNWIGFLLRDDFNKTFHLLHRYAKAETPNISPERYMFVSKLLGSRQFKEKFAEPMTDILFQENTRKRVLIFTWARVPVEPESGKPGPEGTDDDFALPEELKIIEPVRVCFDGLNNTRSIDGLKEINDFVELNYKTDRKGLYEELATKILALSAKILDEADGLETLQKAEEQIDRDFKPENGDDSPALVPHTVLCPTMIWNRLLDHTWQHIYYIPAKFLEGSAVSGVVCAFRERLRLDEYIVLTQIINRVFSLFHFGLYKEEMILFALRSATAAIMARNKSHIHGSHIEHGLRNKMDTFESIIAERLAHPDGFYRTLREKLTLLEENA